MLISVVGYGPLAENLNCSLLCARPWRGLGVAMRSALSFFAAAGMFCSFAGKIFSFVRNQRHRWKTWFGEKKPNHRERYVMVEPCKHCHLHYIWWLGSLTLRLSTNSRCVGSLVQLSMLFNGSWWTEEDFQHRDSD